MRPGTRYRRPLVLAELAVAAAAGLTLWSCSRRPPPLPAGTEVHLTGYHEASFDEQGNLLPVLGAGGEIDVCLHTPVASDTSQWQARFFIARPAAAGKDYQDPVHRLATTFCFRHRLSGDPPPSADLELCGDVRDGFDGRRFRIPCQRLRYRAEGGERPTLLAEMDAAMRSEPGEGRDGRLRDLDGIAARARAAGLPFLALQVDLIAVYLLRQQGTPAALAAARERLARLPAWLDQPGALAWAAPVAYEKALIELDDGWHLKAAWEHLAVADRLCRRVLHPMGFAVRTKQAEILARAGAVGEAIHRLSTAIADCATTPCYSALMSAAHGTLAWLIALDPRATGEDLARAASSLEIALERSRTSGDVLEEANQLINRGYLQWRRGDDPGISLDPARDLLDAGDSGSARGRWLRGWAWLVAGLAALDAGDAGAALESCARARHAEHPRLAAWASSCAGQARRLRGDLDGARGDFEEALLHYEYATPEGLGQAFALAPGGRAEAFYRAARLAVEGGASASAWEILARLDSLTANEARLESCRPPASAEESELLRQLASLEGPAAGRRKRQRDSVRRALRERLRESLRRRPGCAEALQRQPDGPLRFRAFALDDEILLLRRAPDGSLVLDRRTSLPERRRTRLLEEIVAALADRRMPDADWRELTAPLARALVPAAPEALEAVTVFALHGDLQAVPLAALPLPEDGSGAPRWLGDATTVALWPGGAHAGPKPPLPSATPATPLFVVDPRRDLPSGTRLAGTYRELFPGARILAGGDASLARLRRALPAASWLHIDAHASYDPAFPELSNLLLADHPIPLSELAELPASLRFANLSACGTGSWPVTAGSGRYGIAGLLARLGARWVVASRSDLPDRLAADYNLGFYAALRSGLDVPAAHARALAEVGERYPAAAWAALLLLSGGGQSTVPATPLVDESRNRAGISWPRMRLPESRGPAEVANEAYRP